MHVEIREQPRVSQSSVRLGRLHSDSGISWFHLPSTEITSTCHNTQFWFFFSFKRFFFYFHSDLFVNECMVGVQVSKGSRRGCWSP